MLFGKDTTGIKETVWRNSFALIKREIDRKEVIMRTAISGYRFPLRVMGLVTAADIRQPASGCRSEHSRKMMR